MNFHTIHINTPSSDPKKILLWFRGDFPTTNVSVDSFMLPQRIWPNATITVRCNTENLQTIAWVKKVSGGKYRMISDKIKPRDINWPDWDIVWNHDYWFIKKFKDQTAIIEWQEILANVFTTEIYSLYCDPLVLNQIEPIYHRLNWSNVTVVFNQDIVEDYAPKMFSDKFAACTVRPTIAYINMRMYYNLPDEFQYTDRKSFMTDPFGCYFAHFHEPRINFFKKVLPTFPEKYPINIGGRNANKVMHISHAYERAVICDKFSHDHIMDMLKDYDWGLYIGRCRPIPWIGMSFYLPLLAGIPIFCYTKAKEARAIFGNLNCYFSTQEELEQLVKNTDYKKLYNEQIKCIKKFY